MKFCSFKLFLLSIFLVHTLNFCMQAPEKDYYKILDVAKTATEAEIKTAYKKLALQWHPDKAPKGKEKEYTAKFQEIGEAYEVLSNPKKRKTYDQQQTKLKKPEKPQNLQEAQAHYLETLYEFIKVFGTINNITTSSIKATLLGISAGYTIEEIKKFKKNFNINEDQILDDILLVCLGITKIILEKPKNEEINLRIDKIKTYLKKIQLDQQKIYINDKNK